MKEINRASCPRRVYRAMVPPQITQSSVCAPTKSTFNFFFLCTSGRSSGGEGGADESLFAPFSWRRAETATAAPPKPNPVPSNILREIFPIGRRLPSWHVFEARRGRTGVPSRLTLTVPLPPLVGKGGERSEPGEGGGADRPCSPDRLVASRIQQVTTRTSRQTESHAPWRRGSRWRRSLGCSEWSRKQGRR